jgi:hypothetical protein
MQFDTATCHFINTRSNYTLKHSVPPGTCKLYVKEANEHCWSHKEANENWWTKNEVKEKIRTSNAVKEHCWTMNEVKEHLWLSWSNWSTDLWKLDPDPIDRLTDSLIWAYSFRNVVRWNAHGAYALLGNGDDRHWCNLRGMILISQQYIQ